MRLWIDADSCPRAVRDIVCRAGKRLGIPVIFAANHPVAHSREFPVSMVVLPPEKDAADTYIAEHAQHGDLIVTRDIPLAKRLVDLNLAVLNDRGNLYTRENIGERLSIRNFMLNLHNSGQIPESTSKFGPQDVKRFADAFDRTLAKLQKNNTEPAGI